MNSPVQDRGEIGWHRGSGVVRGIRARRCVTPPLVSPRPSAARFRRAPKTFKKRQGARRNTARPQHLPPPCPRGVRGAPVASLVPAVGSSFDRCDVSILGSCSGRAVTRIENVHPSAWRRVASSAQVFNRKRNPRILPQSHPRTDQRGAGRTLNAVDVGRGPSYHQSIMTV